MVKTRNQASNQKPKATIKKQPKAPAKKLSRDSEADTHQDVPENRRDPFPELEPAEPLPPIPESVELVNVDWKLYFDDHRTCYLTHSSGDFE